MIANSQKALIHLYARAARLDDATYRNYLRSCAGVSSAADPKFTQSGFEDLMASLESILESRFEDGDVSDPVRPGGRIRNLSYWRSRRPRPETINSRQAWKIETLWAALRPKLPPECRTVEYLCRIIRKATGKRDTGYAALTSPEAAALIDALTDRLNHAISGKTVAEKDSPLLKAKTPCKTEDLLPF